MVKKCDMCGTDINIVDDSAKICLGTMVQTYDLCRSCANRVDKFILRAKK